jgi:glycosyltransferase involved in cell wall biosynthesis
MNDRISQGEAMLAALLSPALDPLFWRPLRLGYESAWTAHIPFAHWLVSVARPRVFVELGTHNGVSYSAFCEAVSKAGLATDCFAVDTWEGDDHAGHYGNEVFEDLSKFHDQHYGSFSRLLRCTFNAALPYVLDGSVDILHIDGLHSYEAVRHDFEGWLPKLSDRAVVLLHDTNERERGFGVWRCFAELRQKYAGFEFVHEHGLGVLAVGQRVPAEVASLCSMTDPASIQLIRERCSQLGERWRLEAQVIRVTLEAQRRYREQALSEGAAMRVRSAQRAEEARRAAAVAWQEVNRVASELVAIRTERDALKQQRDALAGERARMARSLIWRATAPLRRLSDRVPERVRERGYDMLKMAVWAATFRLGRRLAHRAEVRDRLLMISRSQFFDREWYLASYPDVAATGMDPALHFVLRGGAERRNPGPLFDSQEYLARYPDVAASGAIPLVHYIESGAREGRMCVAVPEPKTAAPPPMPAFADTAAWAVRAPTSELILPAPKIAFISGEPGTPGEFYRIERFSRAAAQVGARTFVMSYRDVPKAREKLLDADIIFIWRAAWTIEIRVAVDTARSIGAKLIFDVDDLMVEPELARQDVIDGIRTLNVAPESLRGHFTRMRDTMANCDFCITTTEELAWHIRQHANPTVVLPNGFDRETLRTSRLAARRRRLRGGDGLIRLGYAAGSRTHQRDFAQASAAVARVLRDRPDCRLVLFKSPTDTLPIVDTGEFPEFAGLSTQIEWRDMVPLQDLPEEMARFDINLAPLEVGNEFCEAKSELKYFEAALVDVCTVASPTGPYRRVIEHQRNGLLAATTDEWYSALVELVDDASRRLGLARAAYLEVLWPFGPERRVEAVMSILQQVRGGPSASRAFANYVISSRAEHKAIEIPDGTTVFESDRLGSAEVTVVVPLYNYSQYIEEALASVLAQTLMPLDLVIVDDMSTDQSLDVTRRWVEQNARHLNRVVVRRNLVNSGLGLSRNAGFAAAETPYVLPLDADNRLRPDCCETLLRHAERTGAAFVYPLIRDFGESTDLRNSFPYSPARLIGVPFIDAMALVSVAAWARVGGYSNTRLGWEDYDFWCRMAEAGLNGLQVADKALAEYRVHGKSMLQSITESADGKPRVMQDLQQQHPWLAIVDAKRQAKTNKEF